MILIAMLPNKFKMGLVYIFFMPIDEIEEVRNVEEQFLNNIYNPEFIVEVVVILMGVVPPTMKMMLN